MGGQRFNCPLGLGVGHSPKGISDYTDLTSARSCGPRWKTLCSVLCDDSSYTHGGNYSTLSFYSTLKFWQEDGTKRHLDQVYLLEQNLNAWSLITRNHLEFAYNANFYSSLSWTSVRTRASCSSLIKQEHEHVVNSFLSKTCISLWRACL